MPPLKPSDEKDPADWFYSAGDRLRVADCSWQHEGLTHSGVELLQEAAERYLKGYLIAKGWRLSRTHDLRKLVEEAQRHEPKFAGFSDLAKELTEDFFAQHYPGGDWSTVGSNYETLRRQVGQMIVLIQQNLPQFFPKTPAN
ncbi:MAG: HEPN domain-containing protein [Limisphaerales bacterium]